MVVGTLNEKGEEYKEGTDKYRYKEVDGELMKLKVEVACCEDDYSKLYNTVIPTGSRKDRYGIQIHIYGLCTYDQPFESPGYR